MITLEVVEELKELEYHLSTYKRGEKNTLIHSEYEDILKKLTDNGEKGGMSLNITENQQKYRKNYLY